MKNSTSKSPVLSLLPEQTLQGIALARLVQLETRAQHLVLPCRGAAVQALIRRTAQHLGVEAREITAAECGDLLSDGAKERFHGCEERLRQGEGGTAYAALVEAAGIRIVPRRELSGIELKNGRRPSIVVAEKGANSYVGLLYAALADRIFVPDLLPQDYETFLERTRDARSLFWGLPCDASLEHLERVHLARRVSKSEVPIGFFYPFGEIEPEVFVLKQILYSIYSSTMTAPCKIFFANTAESFHAQERNAEYLFGYGNDRVQLQKFLSTPSSVMYLNLHSNGVDAFMGSTVLCARKEFDGVLARGMRALPCFTENCCNRVILPEEESALFGVSNIKAQVLCFSSCFGSLLQGASFSPETGLAHQVVRSPYVGALLATRGLTKGAHFNLLELPKRICAGDSLGAAARDVNLKYYKGLQWYPDLFDLWGDPDYSLTGGENLLEESLAIKSPLLNDALEKEGIIQYTRATLSSFERKEVEPPFALRYFQALEYQRELGEFLIRCVEQDRRPVFLRGMNRDQYDSAIASWRGSLEVLKRACSTLNAGFGRFWDLREPPFFQVYKPVQDLQKDWFRLFMMINKPSIEFGQMFFPPAGDVQSRKYRCPYCSEHSQIEWTTAMVNHNSVERRVEDCTNCWTTLDGMSVFRNGRIDFEHSGSQLEISNLRLRFQFDLSGFHAFLCGVVLEPFVDTTSVDKPHSVRAGVMELNGGEIDLEVPALSLKEAMVPGRYLLKAMAMFNENIVFLYRNLFIS